METVAQAFPKGRLWRAAPVIVLLLGTNPYPFDRLLKAMDEWAAVSGEKVIAQVGHTRLPAPHLECHDFAPHERIVAWLKEADVAVCQGGFGSLRDCLMAGKPTIAVPRKPELGECQDVQMEIVSALAAESRVLMLEDMKDLGKAIAAARHLPPPSTSVSRIPNIVAKKIIEILGENPP